MVLPLIFRYSVTFQRGILFLTFSKYPDNRGSFICSILIEFLVLVKYPKGLDLTKPESVGLYATRNFYITVKDHDQDEDGVRVGVWHVLPSNAVRRFKRELRVEEEVAQDPDQQLDPAPGNERELKELSPAIRSEFPVVLPENEQLFYERLLRMPGGTVVLYLHGNTASRGSGHRSEVYKLLRKLNYHVFSFDYRGYADSIPCLRRRKALCAMP